MRDLNVFHRRQTSYKSLFHSCHVCYKKHFLASKHVEAVRNHNCVAILHNILFLFQLKFGSPCTQHQFQNLCYVHMRKQYLFHPIIHLQLPKDVSSTDTPSRLDSRIHPGFPFVPDLFRYNHPQLSLDKTPGQFAHFHHYPTKIL